MLKSNRQQSLSLLLLLKMILSSHVSSGNEKEFSSFKSNKLNGEAQLVLSDEQREVLLETD